MRILISLITILTLAGGAFGGVYVAGGGADYQVSYPDDWYRVPHGEVRYFLDMQGLDDSSFSYDAVFAQNSDKSFFEGPYLFLCSSPDDSVDESWTDTLLKVMTEEYGRDYIEGSLTEDTGQFINDQPVYDKSLSAIAILIPIETASGKKLLFDVRKIYDRGLAVFLCYMPDNMKDATIPVFLDILNSFVSGGTADAADGDIKIVDVSAKNRMPSWLIIVIIAVIIMIAAIFLRKKK